MNASKLLEGRGPLLAAVLVLVLPGAARTASAAEPAKSGQFTPSGKPAASYGSAEGMRCQRSPVASYAMDYLADAAKNNKRPKPESDPRTCAVAESFLSWEPGAVPRPQVLAFVSNYFGLPAAVKVPIVAEFDEGDERTIAERVVQSAAGSAALNAINPRIGMATQKIRKGKQTITRISIVVSDIPVELQPVPRRLEKGQQAKLAGKLVGGAKNPKVFVTDAAGKLSTPEQPPGDAFEATLACGDRPGRIQVEIRGELEGSSGLVASFPVACAEPPPTSVALAGEPWPTEADAAAKKILELVNQERTGAGAPTLEWDAAVAGVAKSIAEDIAAKGAGGAGDLVERFKKEGISAPLILESAAAERTFERANERIMTSPRDRATILNPEANRIGVGAISSTDGEGRPIVYVVEVLIKELPPVDLAKVRDQLREAVAQKRKDARTNPVTPDPVLDEVAEKYAQALAAAGGTLPKEKSSELTAPLNKPFKTVVMISGAKQEALDFAEEPQATAAGKSLGVGVAQGRHPVLGRNAVYVVLMVGTPRGGAAEEASAAPAKKKTATTKPKAK